MTWFTNLGRTAVAAIFLAAGVSVPNLAVADDLTPLFERLKNVDATEYMPIEQRIWREWSKSGSPSLDLLLERGDKALEAGEFARAIEHFTALTDHAPEFAQGFHARARAYYEADLYGPALADLERAIALEPRHFGALSGLAVIFEELGMEDAALELYYAVRAIHPHRENLSDHIDRLEKATAGKRL
ncbi:MAG: hypothetical protein AAF092_13265 [Pseudomonadota bacterium]